MQETELKFSLHDLEAYETVIRNLGPARRVREQTNHYFTGDEGGRLQNGEAMVRLREEDGGFRLAFKEGLVVEGACFRCREVEEDLPPETGRALLAGTRQPGETGGEASRALTASLGEATLSIAGTSRTKRVELDLPGGVVLQADHAVFPGGREDFELEIETADPGEAERELRRLLGRRGIVPKAQTKTKYRRFLEAAGLA